MVGPLLHQPRDAPGGDQLGNADHRPPRSRAGARDQPAGTGLGDPRLHDLLDRAGADGRSPFRPLRPQDRLRRRLRDLRPRLPWRRLRCRRHPADPLADRPGDRRRLHLRQRPGPRHRCLPPRPARAGHGDEHDGRRDRVGDRAGPRRRPRLDLLALGFLVQRPARLCRRPLGRNGPPRARPPRQRPRLRPRRHPHLRRRLDRARLRDLARRHLRLGRLAGDRLAGRRGGAAAALRLDRAPRLGADAGPGDLPQPPLRRRDGPPSSTASPASP